MIHKEVPALYTNKGRNKQTNKQQNLESAPSLKPKITQVVEDPIDLTAQWMKQFKRKTKMHGMPLRSAKQRSSQGLQERP